MTRLIENLVGLKVNHWTVVGGPIKKSKKMYWVCLCDCGTEKEVRADRLVGKKSISCGCKKNPRKIELAGQKFNNWTVTEEFKKTKNRCVVWKCVCACGNERWVKGSDLRAGNSKSCGCLSGYEREKLIENLVGLKVNHWTVIDGPIKKNDRIYWQCLCSCGNKKEVRSDRLMTQEAFSCGCLKRQREIKELAGQKFNSWTVTKEFKKTPRRVVLWKCVCVCGKESWIKGADLKAGSSKSCGCLRGHGMAGSPTYKSWGQMKIRCYNKANHAYKYYGERGITVCKKWLDFKGFLKDMGVMPEGYSLERRDNDKNYCKDNCEWIHKSEQSKNRRGCMKEEDVMVIKTMLKHGKVQAEIVREFGTTPSVISRIAKGKTWQTTPCLPV